MSLPLNDAAPDLDSVAQWLAERGLAAPAALFLELHRPLAFLGSQAMVVGAGVLAPLLGLERFERLQAVLADPAAYEDFLDRLERAARETA